MAAVDARDRIIRAGEQLIAERGAEVPLVDIARAAGQRNNSAVHYHFGSRDGLVSAILDQRMSVLEARRLELLAGLERHPESTEPRALIDVLVRPMFDAPYQQGSTHYARFLVQIRDHPIFNETVPTEEHWPAVSIITARLARILADQAVRGTRARLQSMFSVMVTLVADRERFAETSGKPTTEAAIEDVIGMLVALTTAPSAQI